MSARPGASPGGRPPQPRRRKLGRPGQGSASHPALASIVNGRLVGASPGHEAAECVRNGKPVAMMGYASADTQQGDRASADLRRQAQEIASECERRELRLLEVVPEQGRRHWRSLERPGLGYALGRIAAGEATGLVVSDLSRVSHSLAELGRVLEWLDHRHARFMAARPGLDTDEEAGRLAVRTIIDVSRWERQRLVERTRDGMRAAARKGPASVADDPALSERIAGMRAVGMTLQAIADQLNAEGVPTVRGGARWRPSSVQSAAGYRRPPTGYALDLLPADWKQPRGETDEA